MRQNMKLSINCAISPVSRVQITALLLSLTLQNALENLNHAVSKSWYPRDGLQLWHIDITYKISLLHDATQPRGHETTVTLRHPVKLGGNLPASTGNKYYLHTNLRGTKILHSKERPGHPRKAVSQTLINHPINTRQWEHLSHTLKNTPFNPAHIALGQHCSICIFFLKSTKKLWIPIYSCIHHLPLSIQVQVA